MRLRISASISGVSPSCSTSERSSFTASQAERESSFSFDVSRPKSSSTIETPRLLRRFSCSSMVSEFSRSTASDTSTRSREPAKPVFDRACRTVPATSPLRNWASETLIDRVMWRGHSAAVVSACWMIHSPSGWMSPLSSAIGTKTVGGHLAELRMVHAHQRLKSGQPTRAEVVLRLEVQIEPALAQPLADRPLHLADASRPPSPFAARRRDMRCRRPSSRREAQARRCAGACSLSSPCSGETAMPMLALGRAWRGTWAHASFSGFLDPPRSRSRRGGRRPPPAG